MHAHVIVKHVSKTGPVIVTRLKNRSLWNASQKQVMLLWNMSQKQVVIVKRVSKTGHVIVKRVSKQGQPLEEPRKPATGTTAFTVWNFRFSKWWILELQSSRMWHHVVNLHFRGICCLHLILRMVAVGSSITLVTINQVTRCHIPEDSNLNILCSQNLKSHKIKMYRQNFV
jgi:hypothetical protein